jgi:cytochrome c oxidase subunit 2
MKYKNKLLMIPAFVLTMLSGLSSKAFAGAPVPWQLNFQEAASPVMERITSFHDMLLVIITLIAAFVFLLLAIVIVRFNAKANPKPSETTHNATLEVVWTVIPVIILIIISVPSFKLLYYADRVAEPDMTLKVTGYQWYWGYEYPDHEGLSFDSYMIPDDEITGDQVRLLSTDNKVVLPIDTNIQLIITAEDVLHAWAVPALGVKLDAVPGRLNETWVRITKPGTYYGQCSELCGKGHGFMPIEIKAVTKEEFKRWVASAKKEFAANDNLSLIKLAEAKGVE